MRKILIKLLNPPDELWLPSQEPPHLGLKRQHSAELSFAEIIDDCGEAWSVADKMQPVAFGRAQV